MYTLREFCKDISGIAKSLQKVRQIGYEAVQVSGFGPAGAKDVAKALSDNGLVCCSTHMGWQRFTDDFDALVADHKLWKCTHPAIGAMPKEFRTAEGVAKFAPMANEVGRKLAEHGMDFSYHNHNFEFVRQGGKALLETLYELTDARYVKAEIDTHWVQAGGGDPAAWVRKYAGRMPILHLKDMVMAPEGGQRFAEVGEGNLNWPAILKAAKAAKVQWYCVEQDDCYGRDPFESLKISLYNLHKLGLK
jgi:sugar phosphate isomerase/epimerase